MTSEHRRKLIMDLSAHFIVTFLLVILVYTWTASLVYAAAVILGGIFIDLDHLIDYALYFGARFDLQDFLGSSALASGKIYLFLHSWEIVLILFLMGLAARTAPLLALSLGMAGHLIVDQVQIKNPRAYFLVYRMLKKFNVRIIFPEFSG